MNRVELDTLPSVVSLFARSLLPGGRRSTELTSTELPPLELSVRDHRVDTANLAAYQRLCGFDVTFRLPSTYLHVQAFPLAVAVMADRSFPLPLLGLVHVHNQITQYRPVDATENLSLRAWAADLRAHPAGRQVDLHAEALVDGELVWTGTGTYLRRQAKARPAGGPPKPKAVADPPLPSALWRLPKDLGRRYAEVSGDRNPIHLSALSAKMFGFPRAIAHGMYLHARALSSVSARLPDQYLVDVSFKTPALLPSKVAFESERDGDSWNLEISAARCGKPHLAATTTRLPQPP